MACADMIDQFVDNHWRKRLIHKLRLLTERLTPFELSPAGVLSFGWKNKQSNSCHSNKTPYFFVVLAFVRPLTALTLAKFALVAERRE